MASKWVVLITGGALVAAVAIFEHWAKRPISWDWYRRLGAVTLMIAVFSAWRTEHDSGKLQGSERAKLISAIHEKDEEMKRLNQMIQDLQVHRAIEVRMPPGSQSSSPSPCPNPIPFTATRLSPPLNSPFQFEIRVVANIPRAGEIRIFHSPNAHLTEAGPRATGWTQGDPNSHAIIVDAGRATLRLESQTQFEITCIDLLPARR